MYSTKNKNTKSKKLWLIVSAIAVLAAVGAGLFVLGNHRQKVGKTSTDVSVQKYNPPTAEEKKQVQDSKTAVTGDTAPSSPAEVPQPSTMSDVIIISAEQDGDKNLIVKTRLNGVHWASCALSVTGGGKTITKNADTLYQPEFSTCTGYVIGASELNAGSYNLILAAKKTDGSSYSSTPKVVSIVK